MTLEELKERVDHAYGDGHNAHLEVCIPNNKTGMMGGTPTTMVKFAHQGIDWDHNKFFIIPEKNMIDK